MNKPEKVQTRRDIEAQIIAKAWKDDAYKQKLLTNTKAVIEREFEVELPAEVEVRVVEESPTSLCFVLPMPPEIPGHELSEEELEAVAGGGDGAEKVVASTVAYSASLLSLASGWYVTKLAK